MLQNSMKVRMVDLSMSFPVSMRENRRSLHMSMLRPGTKSIWFLCSSLRWYLLRGLGGKEVYKGARDYKGYGRCFGVYFVEQDQSAREVFSCVIKILSKKRKTSQQGRYKYDK